MADLLSAADLLGTADVLDAGDDSAANSRSRWRVSVRETNVLEAVFASSPRPNKNTIHQLATMLGVKPRQVQVRVLRRVGPRRCRPRAARHPAGSALPPSTWMTDWNWFLGTPAPVARPPMSPAPCRPSRRFRLVRLTAHSSPPSLTRASPLSSPPSCRRSGFKIGGKGGVRTSSSWSARGPCTSAS
ncbi:hypothetical protein T492DRAFT_238397 [Pavlovales sp. CCMP2436]|nr:hypothetical protein T492DRAFT_238397 [Pavlovales sp. CCMP2436]|mmetsp:Transcript_12617/g.31958  ORF Transcript_12617/g.31958 Transcript_12617/m.31958 type:complete len:187 (-) Transcript_12617:150-710(-)